MSAAQAERNIAIAVAHLMIDELAASFGPVSAATLAKQAVCRRLESELRTFGASVSGAEAHAEHELIRTLSDPKASSAQVVSVALRGAEGITRAEVEVRARQLLADQLIPLGNAMRISLASELAPYIRVTMQPAVLAAYAVITEASRTLPAQIDDSIAFRAGGEVAEEWHRVLEASAKISSALGLRRTWINNRWLQPPRRDAADSFLVCTNPFAVDDSRLIIAGPWDAAASVAGMFGDKYGSGISSTLPAGFEPRLLEMARRGARFHFPTPVEQDAAAGKWLDADRETQRRLAGMDPTAPIVETTLSEARDADDYTGRRLPEVASNVYTIPAR